MNNINQKAGNLMMTQKCSIVKGTFQYRDLKNIVYLLSVILQYKNLCKSKLKATILLKQIKKTTEQKQLDLNL